MAVENGGIGGKPANPRADNPRSESIFVYELKPGQTVDDAVQLINNTDQEKTLLVYPVDSQVASDGAFACAQKADTPASVGTWIDLETESVTLAANSSEEVPFTLAVPDTASVGEQNGCIAIQDTEKSQRDGENGVVLSFRSAIRVAVTVPGEITKQLDFVGAPIVNVEEDIVQLAVGLKNNGNVSLDSDVSASIDNIFRVAVSSVNGVYPILANNQATFNFEVDRPFWGGWYLIGAQARYNNTLDESIGQGDVEFNETVSSPTSWQFIAPQTKALVIEIAAAVVIIGGVTAFLLRRRKYQQLHANATTYKAKKGQSLQDIAKKHDVSWKTLAKINNIKPPYHIEPGQELAIPVAPKDTAESDEQG